MDASLLKTQYHIGVMHLPNPNGMNVAQIKGVDQEEYTSKENGISVRKVRGLLWLEGFRLPLRLYNWRLDILIAILGGETNDWIGRKIGLYVAPKESFGKMAMDVFVDHKVHDRIGTEGQMTAAPATPAITGAAPATPHGLPANFDVRRIGEKRAAEFKTALAELGATFDSFLAWLKGKNAAVHERCFGIELADLPLGIKAFKDEYLTTVAGNSSNDDIPF